MKPNYRARQMLGWAVIVLVSIIPVFLWYFLGPGPEELFDYGSITHSLGELFGLVGMTMFALTFVLSTRIKKIEDVFGGLDKVYLAHGILGGTALILILCHPIFLVIKFIPSDIKTAANYLLPSSYWSVNFGIISLIGLIVLIYITLYTKMKYHRWKFTHEFLGVMFLLSVLHIFMVKGIASQDYIFRGYYAYAMAVSLIGISAFFYSLFLKDRMAKNAIYKISNIEHNKDFFVIEIMPEHKPISYKSGQFIFIRFYNKHLSKESHPFSIASKSNAETIRIVIKKLGDFTSKLEHLRIGGKVSIEGPYGRFHFKNYRDHEQIWIGAGIGITPFLGMVEDLDEHLGANVKLFYTASDDSEFVGYDLLSDVEKRVKGFTFIPWNSRIKGRLDALAIGNISKGLKNKEFLICGSPGFKESIINQLISEGVSKNRIHEEAFDFR